MGGKRSPRRGIADSTARLHECLECRTMAPMSPFILVDPKVLESSPERDAAWAEEHAAEEAIAAAATARDRSALLAGAAAYVIADAKSWAVTRSERAAEGKEFIDARWSVWVGDEIGAFLLTEPVAYAAEIRATLRTDDDPPKVLLATLPEDEWPGFNLRELLVLRMLDGDWRPLVDLERRLPGWSLRGNVLKPEIEANRVIDALGRRDPDDAREAIMRFARSLARPDRKAFSMFAYALFQEARNLGLAIRPPRAYDFLGEPDLARAREMVDRGPVSMASLSVRDWVASCFCIEPAALGESEVEMDPAFKVTYRAKPDGPFVARILAIPDTEGRLGRIWRLAVQSPRGYHSLDVATDDLRLDPARL